MTPCPVCGTPFEPKRKSHIRFTCSPPCGRELTRQANSAAHPNISRRRATCGRKRTARLSAEDAI